MPPSTWYPIYELLTRHGVDHEVAKAAAKNDLRAWELPEIAAFLKTWRDQVANATGEIAWLGRLGNLPAI